jgi:hypothetical protein
MLKLFELFVFLKQKRVSTAGIWIADKKLTIRSFKKVISFQIKQKRSS